MKRLSEEASVCDWNLSSEGPKKSRVLGTNCEEFICLEQAGARTDGIRVLNPIDCSEIQRVENRPVVEQDRALGRSVIAERKEFDRHNSTRSEAIAAVDRGKGKMVLDFDLNVESMDFDLNLPAAEGTGEGFREFTIIQISSDESEVDDETGERGCVSVIGGRRYTREEKGKAKLVDSHPWLSLAMNPMQLDLIPERQELNISADSGFVQQQMDGQQEETTQLLETETVHIRREPEPLAAQESIQRMRANRFRDVARDNALRFARFNSNQNNYIDPFSQGTQVQTALEDADKNLENFVGPFSTAMKLLKERNLRNSAEQLINWKPSEGLDRKVVTLVPSLLDLSMKVLAKNAEAIVSLEYVPDALKHRLADMLCDSRKMNARALDLLVQGSPNEIRIKDCSWLTDEHFTKIFGSFDSKSLKVTGFPCPCLASLSIRLYDNIAG